MSGHGQEFNIETNLISANWIISDQALMKTLIPKPYIKKIPTTSDPILLKINSYLR